MVVNNMRYIKLYDNINFNDIDEINDCSDYPEFEGHEDFCGFLKDNGVLDKFIKNCYKDSVKDISKYLDKVSPIDYISSAFHWYIDNNNSMWARLDDEWVNYIRNVIS
jgi:pyoverdine/dityrosine biosynthesis protein Dit1